MKWTVEIGRLVTGAQNLITKVLVTAFSKATKTGESAAAPLR